MVQQSWRAAALADRWRWRRIRRIATSFLLAGLIVCLVILLSVPFLHPKTHLFVLAAAGNHPLAGPELDYLENDLEAFRQVGERLTSRGSVRGLTRLDNLRSREGMSGLNEDLRSRVTRSSDILILYVCSSLAIPKDGIANGERPHLVCGDVQATMIDINEAAYSIEDLLDQVKECKASVKLLLMDVGRTDYDSRLGFLGNGISDRLRSIVKETGDRSLWVLTSNAGFERSHVARSLEQSVFVYFVAHGLEGGADTSGDGYVSVDELHRYVAINVRALTQAQTDDQVRQTPELLWGGGALSQATSYPRLLAVGRSRREPERERLSRTTAVASEASRAASYYGLVRTPSADELAYRATAGLRPGGQLGFVSDQLLGSAISRVGPVPVRIGTGNGPIESGESTVAGDGGGDGSSPASDSGEEGGTEVTDGDTDGPGAEAKVAKSDSVSGGKPAEKVAPNPEAQRRYKQDRIARLLAAAWQLRDVLRHRELPSETRQLQDLLRDSGSAADIPFDYAPHLWRLLEQWLLRYDRQFRAGAIAADEFAGQLEGVVDSLRTFTAGEKLIPGVSDPMLLRIAAAKFLAWPDADTVFSLGLADFLARKRAVPLPKELQSRVAALDGFIRQGDQKAFQQWVEKSLTPEYGRFQEFWLARRLAQETEIPWSDQQLVMQTRRGGEQVAAASLPCLPWVRDKIEAADRRRLAGERELLDRIAGDWQPRAQSLLSEARDGYRGAQQDIYLLIAARQQSNDLAERCRGYVRWCWAAGLEQHTDVPGYKLLARLLDSLNSLCVLLDNPDPTRLAQVRRLHSQLAALQKEVESGLSERAISRIVGSPGDPWKIESLLLTSLPSAAARLQLLAGAGRVEVDRLDKMTFPDLSGPPPAASGLNRRDWESVLGLARLEWELAGLAVSHSGDRDDVAPSLDYTQFVELDTALQELEEAARSTNPARDVLAKLPRLSDATQAFYRELPEWIERLSENEEGLRDPQRRETSLHQLRTAIRGMQHVNPRDALRLQSVDIARTLTRSALFDQLAWQRDRALVARHDAPAGEATNLTGMARGYRQLAASIRSQPILRADLRPPIRLDGPTSVSLATVSEAPLQLAIHNSSPRTMRIWAVLDYDPSILQLAAGDETPVYHQRMPASVPSEIMPDYSYGSDLLNAPTTGELSQGASATLDLTVRRIAMPARPVKLICKVLAIDAQDGTSTYLRYPVEVAIATSGTIELEIAGTPGSWTRSEGRLTLHAFANRSTDFEFRLRNLTSTDQQVDVQLLGSDVIAAPTLPAGAVPPQEAAKLLAGFAPTTVLVAGFPVTLAAGGEALGITFPPTAKQPPAKAEAADSDAKPPAGSDAKQGAVAPSEKAAPKPLPRNMLLILTDQQTGRQTIRHIALTVQRPRRFLRPLVSYNPERERVELRLRLVAPGLLPTGNMHVHAELGGDIPAGLQVRFDAEISPENPEILLNAPVPAASERIATLHLSVDDYPRAFVYEVPCWSLATDIPEKTDLMDVRITGLPEGETYKAPAGNIPVRFEVDAPRGAFEDDRDVLYVGYDLDRDRELNDEPRIALHADRQVELYLEGVSPNGRLTISSRVGDFEQKLPAVPTRGARLGVLAELSVAGRMAWSNTVEVTVDGEPPRVYQPRLRPGSELAPGSEAELSVLATDDGLSGVAKVEAAIDVEGTNEFGGANEPVVAQQNPESGVWVAKLPTTELAPGVHRVLLRATDKVENVGDVTTLNIRVLSIESAESAGLNRVPGLVLYGLNPVAEAEVKLVPAEGKSLSTVSSEQGTFEFPKVPPGKYKLSARGLLRNRYRTAEVEIEVAAPPAQVILQELQLR